MPRTEGETCHAFLMEHAFHFTYPYRDTAVGVFFDGRIYRHIGAGTMVLRPVEFDTAGNPRTYQSYQSRFDDVIVIDEMAFFDFVVSHLDTSSQFGENHYFDVLIFNEYRVIGLVCFLIRHGLYDRIRINHPAAALINTLL